MHNLIFQGGEGKQRGLKVQYNMYNNTSNNTVILRSTGIAQRKC